MTITLFQNAFMEKLGPKFDLSRMLVVDFMHEFELGVWKALFVHLIRILYAAAPGGRLVSILDKRYDLSVMVLCLLHGFIDSELGFAKYPSSARQFEDSPIMCPK
jgi:hypothetical protein